MRRIIGIGLIIAAVLGLILSAGGIATIWIYKKPLTTNIVTTVDLFDSSLNATAAGLLVADQTLATTSEDITVIESTIQTASKSLEDTIPMFDSVTGLLRNDLPTSILSMQTALGSAQAAAQSIEGFLVILSSIPLLPLGTYDPEVPLTGALGDVSTSLDPIPQSFIDMADNLQTSQGNLSLISAQVNIMSGNVGELKTSISQSQEVLAEYQEVIHSLQIRVNSIQSNLPTVLDGIAWVMTIFLIWLGITQVGLLTQGLERIRNEEKPPSG
jgi:methyl-accepting chemotaxis protein